MVSSKGKPTDPKLREDIKNNIKNESNKDGSGKGQWAAWKATKLSQEYEKKGGGYENEAGSKNEPKKGVPEHKTEAKKTKEIKEEKGDAKKATKDGDDNNNNKNARSGSTKKKAETKAKEGTRKSERTRKRKADDNDEPKNGEKTKKSIT